MNVKIMSFFGALVALVAMAATAAPAIAAPPPPRTEKVDFTNNQAVLVDHMKNSKHGEAETATAIKQFGNKNEIEWESLNPGEVNKTWPVAYVQGEKIMLEARFALEAGTREFLEKRTEGEPEITGETVVAGEPIKFAKKLTLAEIKEQLEKHNTYLTTGVIGSNALPKKVRYSIAKIVWKWTIKEVGNPIPFVQALGESMHNFYLLYEKPVETIYFTLLDLNTLDIQMQAEPLNEQKVIAGTWQGFQRKEKEGEPGKCKAECPTVHIRTYNPATGAITRVGTTVLWYYQEVTPGKTLKQYLETIGEPECLGVNTTEKLLEKLTGECGAWQKAFKSALSIEGLASTPLKLATEFPKNETKQCEALEACLMLVKKWRFIGEGTSKDPEFPFTKEEVEDENGLAGQGIENPNSLFKNHQVVEVENNLYDPSYGVGPIGNGKAGERAVNLKKYQEQSIGGFCNLLFNCQPAPEVLKLHAE